MTNETQFKTVIRQLHKTGKVYRNWALQRYITRLSAIIFELKKGGYKFSAYYEISDDGYSKNYVYIMREKPKKKKK